MHRLAPYESWESFRDEARRLWDIYYRVARPRKVVRVAVRYINRLDLPLPVLEMKDYLRTSPEVSPDLPQRLAGFFMQLIIPQEDIKATLPLRETTGEPPAPDVASVILDVDVFRTDDLPSDEDGVWGVVEDLGRRSRQVFEACITEKTRELFR
jgi:uncharacterized protein (TIGR04255 family)